MDALKLGAILLALVAFGLWGCTSPEAQDDNGTADVELPEWIDYENHLQRPLFDLVVQHLQMPVQTPDRSGELDVDAHFMVQVEIQISPDAQLPSGYLILEEGRAQLGENVTVQAYVRVDQLLDLALEPEVQYLRAPTRPRR